MQQGYAKHIHFLKNFSSDDSWNFDKFLNAKQKLIFMLLYKYMIFPFFLLTLVAFKLSETFFCQ